ncbi:discoidin domain-containing protein [Clostridium celatum]|uniref:discoidin domain-containing protein n=1 Tax=Clostridium celatum TaxID=36834 RepID=UPI00189C3825|nr:discoidin domain-containing protein [Clostridium celatum]MDU6297302.1 discoidin domain-containing protein [Clostridium celatum]MDY3359404.1 discoidin domain-containing protein [Clostridium celatum]
MRKKGELKIYCKIFVIIFLFNMLISPITNIFANEVKAEVKDTYGINLALNKEVEVSGTETSSLTGDKAVDGDYTDDNSRWSSATVTDSNPQWLYVDLEKEYIIEEINIRWQNWAYGTEFKVQKSNNGEEWTDIALLTNPLGKDEANKNLVNIVDVEQESARYIRVYITKRNQWTSVSIRELEVIGYEIKEGNIAEGKKATVSAVENNSTVWTADKVIDGDKESDDSRWASPTMPVIPTETDTHWVSIDFGKIVEMDSVNIHWYKKAWAENAIIQISNDGENFEDIETIIHEAGDTLNLVDTVQFAEVKTGRYLRVFIAERNANAYNNVSIREIEVIGREKYIPELDMTCEQVINSITTLGEITIDTTELTLPEVPRGFGIRVRGSEFENIVTNDGVITRHNINDANVSILLEVYKESDDTKTATKNIVVTIPGKSSLYPEIFPEVSEQNDVPKVIPSLQEWYGLNGSFTLTENSRILINDVNNVDLNKVADLFNDDLKYFTDIELEVVEVSSEEEVKPGDIYIESIDENGYDLGKEGYFTIIDDSIKIYSPTYTGNLYGTVTLLQILWQAEDELNIPCGIIRDYPKYEIRGVMLDVARMPMRIEFVRDYAKILSWYKLNEFHLHLNDNQWSDGDYKNPEAWNDVYNAFRLESKEHPGLKPSNSDLNDPYYTQEEFIELELMAMDYGMEVVPEIDSPAHSLPFTKYMRELGTPIHNTKYWFDHIDIENEDGKNLIKGLLDEFIDGTDENEPVFLGNTVHLGIDEYDTSVGDKFRQYTSEMSNYVLEKGKTPRVWGSLKQFSGTTMLPEGTVIDVWSMAWEDVNARIKEGYEIVNVPQPFTYITPSRWHKDFMNTQNVYNNWEPNDFNGVKLPLGEPQLLGGKMAIWGDESMEGIVEADLHERLLPAVATVGEKTWSGTREDKDYLEFMKTFNALEEGPNTTIQNEIVSENELVVKYNFEDETASDSSLNKYDASIVNGEVVQVENNKVLTLKGNTTLETPLQSLTYPYTATFDVKVDELGKTINLFAGYDGELKIKEDGTLSIRRSFYEQDFDFKVKEEEWNEITLVGTFQALALYVNGEFVQQLHSYRDHSNNIISGQELHATFVLPLEKIGENLKGQMDNIEVYNTAMPEEWIAGDKNAKLNLACGADAYSSSNSLLYTKEWRAVDGDSRNGDSKWISQNSDNQWLLIDLKEVKQISEVKLLFAEAATEYKILTSIDGVNFEEVSHITSNTKTEVVSEFDLKNIRYIKFQGVKRGGNNGYSILELQAFGENVQEEKSADFNNDGVIDLKDLAIASRYYGQNNKEYDLDGDGKVGIYELQKISDIILSDNRRI